jgi:hypothetical protein
MAIHQADAHAEEGRDEHEVQVEAEQVHVARGVANERELEEENQPGISRELDCVVFHGRTLLARAQLASNDHH